MQHVAAAGDGSGSEADSEGEDEEREDWNTVESTYVTSDGDILPNPSYFKVKQGESSASNGHVRASVEGPSREQVQALAAQKRELSD